MQDFNSLDSTLFQKKITKQKIIDCLNCKVPNDGKYYRVRLLVDVDSNVHIEYTQLPNPSFSYESLEDAANSEPCCNIVLDKEPILEKPNNPFVIHKTTRRGMYDKSRERTSCDWHAALDKPFDVVLWNERGEITETSIANIAIRVCEDGKKIGRLFASIHYFIRRDKR
ncbi:hypothetical protein RO3G_15817 [Rhizopus delemar RA 99-880]|uniref:Uncharacterized protein n=1 Tax=Rhizopus delemar (strain RA 99-880 / ATCC MYA-4621 / FGSC 9543 / NRRL 43880) TaxID=246409 RepID=I1CRM6_RHIO9|nr:hypothetical protein RO3G_15817 [Rhizopus delemar RA 99-880]|eukprot:EIE91106.1 hypothetical protein RO3G_15817 [Rhizopus delemar RA 99-880]